MSRDSHCGLPAATPPCSARLAVDPRVSASANISDEDVGSLGLTGLKTFASGGIAEGLPTKKRLHVTAIGEGGKATKFSVTTRIGTPNEVDYFAHGGILLYMLRQLFKAG